MDNENPDLEKLEQNMFEYYETHSDNVIERTASPGRDEQLAKFLSLMPEHAAILDAGCGAGYDSLYMLASGFDVISMDASSTLVNFASQLTQRPVLHLKFQEIEFDNRFDGIWANASLLHVPRKNLSAVIRRLANALKPGGILFTKFVHGTQQTQRGGILFNDLTEALFEDVLSHQANLQLLQAWVSPDDPPARPGREWLHVLVQKEKT